MNEKELAVIRLVFDWADYHGRLDPPDNLTDVEWMYFLQKLGFEKGCNLMVGQGFPGVEEPMTVKRSNTMTPEEYQEAIDRR